VESGDFMDIYKVNKCGDSNTICLVTSNELPIGERVRLTKSIGSKPEIWVQSCDGTPPTINRNFLIGSTEIFLDSLLKLAAKPGVERICVDCFDQQEIRIVRSSDVYSWKEIFSVVDGFSQFNDLRTKLIMEATKKLIFLMDSHERLEFATNLIRLSPTKLPKVE
jgi:hypothetical protein